MPRPTSRGITLFRERTIVKLKDLKIGVVYYYDRSPKWAEYGSSGSGGIVFDTQPAPDFKETGVSWRRSFVETAAGAGTHVKARLVNDDGSDIDPDEPKHTYLRPSTIRGTLSDCRARQKQVSEQKDATRKREQAQREAAEDHREALTARLTAAGFTVGYASDDIHLLINYPTRQVKVEMSGTMLEVLLDRMGS